MVSGRFSHQKFSFEECKARHNELLERLTEEFRLDAQDEVSGCVGGWVGVGGGRVLVALVAGNQHVDTKGTCMWGAWVLEVRT